MTLRKKACRQCQTKFTPTRDWHSFCTDACRVKWYKELHAAYRQARRRKIEQREKTS